MQAPNCLLLKPPALLNANAQKKLHPYTVGTEHIFRGTTLIPVSSFIGQALIFCVTCRLRHRLPKFFSDAAPVGISHSLLNLSPLTAADGLSLKEEERLLCTFVAFVISKIILNLYERRCQVLIFYRHTSVRLRAACASSSSVMVA